MAKKDKDDIDFEIQFYESILKERPCFVEALMALGDLYTKKGLHAEGLRIDERLYQLKADDPLVLYNLTCSYSLLNKIDSAFRTLKEALENGYDDINYLVADPDLENLRKDYRFPKLLSEVKQQK